MEDPKLGLRFLKKSEVILIKGQLKIETDVCMSSDDPAFYNAWLSVMGPTKKKGSCVPGLLIKLGEKTFKTR